MLDAMEPSDPILLLAVVDGEFKDVPADLRSWFGFMKGNRVALKAPLPVGRRLFLHNTVLSLFVPYRFREETSLRKL